MRASATLDSRGIDLENRSLDDCDSAYEDKGDVGGGKIGSSNRYPPRVDPSFPGGHKAPTDPYKKCDPSEVEPHFCDRKKADQGPR